MFLHGLTFISDHRIYPLNNLQEALCNVLKQVFNNTGKYHKMSAGHIRLIYSNTIFQINIKWTNFAINKNMSLTSNLCFQLM